MEKKFEPIDQATKRIVKEAGLKSPSANFVSNVLQQIEVKPISEVIYQPLITKRGWLLVLVLLTLAVITLVLFPFSETFFSRALEDSASLSFELPSIEVPKTSLYAFGLLMLFLLQIPVLKRYFVK